MALKPIVKYLFQRDTFSVAKLQNKSESMYISAHIFYLALSEAVYQIIRACLLCQT